MEPLPEDLTAVIPPCSASPFRYQLLERLPDGAISERFWAESLDFPGTYLVKLLKPTLMADPVAVERFEQEARFCPMLQHPRMVRCLDSGRTPEGRPFIALERMEGDSLADHLEREGPISPESLSRLMVALCEAVEFLHRAGVVHGGITPRSIYLDGGLQAFQPKLGDFELALFPGSACPAIWPGQPELLGAVYPCPEDAPGRQPTRRSDLYALGALMFHALTGSPPPPELSRPPSLPPSASYLTPLVDRCLQRRPEERFSSVTELAALLGGSRPAKPRISELEPLDPKAEVHSDSPYFTAGTAPSLRSLGVELDPDLVSGRPGP